MAPMGLLLMLYALWMYRWRTSAILNRSASRYDDQRGPVALVAILVVVMFVSYGLTLHAAITAVGSATSTLATPVLG